MNVALNITVLVLCLTFTKATERPIIGIVTEEVNPKTYQNYTSLIAASYIKAVEQSGARVVPIFINKTDTYYRDILSAVNGVLFPGGGVYFTDAGGYADAARIIVNYTKQINSEGDHFPVLGVCLGYELLLYLEVNTYEILDYCNASDLALPLLLKNNYNISRLYRSVPKDVVRILSHQPVTYNHHKRCITEDQLKQYHLDSKWHVLSTSVDSDGKEFISSIESYHYPIAGIQFHPEKNAYEWNPTKNIPHSHKAIHSARYFYDWLVAEARKNNHSFSNEDAESGALIYNYDPTYIKGENRSFEQIYLFKY